MNMARVKVGKRLPECTDLGWLPVESFICLKGLITIYIYLYI